MSNLEMFLLTVLFIAIVVAVIFFVSHLYADFDELKDQVRASKKNQDFLLQRVDFLHKSLNDLEKYLGVMRIAQRRKSLYVDVTKQKEKRND